MSIKKVNGNHYIVDKLEDMTLLPIVPLGCKCLVIEEACYYRATSDGRWIRQEREDESSESTGGNENYVSQEQLNAALTDYATTNYVDTAIEDISQSEVFNMFAEDPEIMASNPGSTFGIALNSGDTRTLSEAMLEKGNGLYTFWIHKSNPDLPPAAFEKQSSCRGLCCVDTVKETGWYGWAILIDHDGYMYSRYIRNSVPSDWRAY